MAFWSWFSGRVQVKVTSADIPSALSAIEGLGLTIDEANMEDDMEISFWIPVKDLRPLQKMCEKRGEEIQVLSQKGISFSLRKAIHRPVLVLGLIGIVLISLWAQGRVLFVFVEGNMQVPTNLIVEEAAACGITFGASSREIRSEKVKNALLAEMPQLQWVGVNTKGCTAVISVSERKLVNKAETNHQVSSIVALRDGIVREMTVLQGTALCTTGQTVKAGQVLISGYTDCGICIRAGNAKGEVFGETTRTFAAISPTDYAKRMEIGVEKKKYSIIIGKKRINLWNNSGISEGGCVRIYLEQYVTLPGGFRLPIAIGVERYIYCETEAVTLEETEDALLSFMEKYLQSQMIAGRVLSAVHTKTKVDGICRMDGIYDCYEIIGIIHPEESISNYENH